MAKTEKKYESLKNLDIASLVQKRKSLESEKIKEIAQNLSKTQSDNKKVRQIRRQIAQIETLISQKSYEQV